MATLACYKCGRAHYRGAQTVTPPGPPTYLWQRRTTCRFCGAMEDEIRTGLAVQILSRDEETVVGGGNPFDSYTINETA